MPQAKTAIRSGGFWSSDAERARVERVVTENPQRKGEAFHDYLTRLAVLGGIMPMGHTE